MPNYDHGQQLLKITEYKLLYVDGYLLHEYEQNTQSHYQTVSIALADWVNILAKPGVFIQILTMKIVTMFHIMIS